MGKAKIIGSGGGGKLDLINGLIKEYKAQNGEVIDAKTFVEFVNTNTASTEGFTPTVGILNASYNTGSYITAQLINNDPNVSLIAFAILNYSGYSVHTCVMSIFSDSETPYFIRSETLVLDIGVATQPVILPSLSGVGLPTGNSYKVCFPSTSGLRVFTIDVTYSDLTTSKGSSISIKKRSDSTLDKEVIPVSNYWDATRLYWADILSAGYNSSNKAIDVVAVDYTAYITGTVSVSYSDVVSVPIPTANTGTPNFLTIVPSRGTKGHSYEAAVFFNVGESMYMFTLTTKRRNMKTYVHASNVLCIGTSGKGVYYGNIAWSEDLKKIVCVVHNKANGSTYGASSYSIAIGLVGLEYAPYGEARELTLLETIRPINLRTSSSSNSYGIAVSECVEDVVYVMNMSNIYALWIHGDKIEFQECADATPGVTIHSKLKQLPFLTTNRDFIVAIGYSSTNPNTYTVSKISVSKNPLKIQKSRFRIDGIVESENNGNYSVHVLEEGR